MGQSSERTRAGARSGAKKRVFGKHQVEGSFNYYAADDLKRLVALVAKAGDRISFGYTSAGNCASVTVLNGPPPHDTFYARNEAEWDVLLDDILQGYEKDEKDEAWA